MLESDSDSIEVKHTFENENNSDQSMVRVMYAARVLLYCGY